MFLFEAYNESKQINNAVFKELFPEHFLKNNKEKLNKNLPNFADEL